MTVLIRTLHAEWTKVRTVQGPAWLLLATVGLTVALTAAATGTASCGAAVCTQDIPKLSLTGIQLGQAVVAILAVLQISSEYSVGMMSITLTATPRRSLVLAAKAIVVGGAALVAGLVAVGLSLVVAHLVLPTNATLSLADGPTARAAFGSVLYLALVALLSLGIAAAIRDAAVAVGVVLAVLYLSPVFTHLISDPIWQRHLQQIGPMSAGLDVQATTDLASLPLTPWSGLGVLALWAVGALVGGGLLLCHRDA